MTTIHQDIDDYHAWLRTQCEAGVARLPGWQIRRLAPDAHKLDLHEIGEDALGKPLLRAMAADLAAVHAADRHSAAIAPYLADQPEGWLEASIVHAAGLVKADFEAYGKA